jgi:tetratricopeptide (TPR) repeat protein
VAALRTFALVDRESIVYERDPAITTETIRLHRLMREVAAARLAGDARDAARRALIAALAAVYPNNAYNDPTTWPRCASLTPHALALCGTEASDAAASQQNAELLGKAGSYFHGRAAYAAARPPFERALASYEKVLGPEHPLTALSLNNLAFLLRKQGDLVGAKPLYERALAIYVSVLGPEGNSTITGKPGQPQTSPRTKNPARSSVANARLTGKQSQASILGDRTMILYRNAFAGFFYPLKRLSFPHLLCRIFTDFLNI